ncbi:malate dehydrogenase [Otariodibacter oris]|uniref:Malate dehydrogenase n=1 Tax=Otariodibacter oris TaxID=1032623 RepID=A0A420XHR3_9PAST|nr:malate dehydrogenase [Otariodibacter oris]QGM81019.1 malate dehydrogenase [Otariodibacter oris]RKR76799.1 malate dehydrogenase (NAD) [Otariodibacter oris]
MKVTLLGAAGGIGQSLALLLKLQLPEGTNLALYDIAPVTPGIAADIDHIPTSINIVGYCGDDPSEALKGSDLVLITAGVRKTVMDRAELFDFNAGIIKNLIEKIAEVCPKACIGIITNPVNTMVPVAAELLKKAGVYDERKLFGVTSLDLLRSERFVARLKGKDVNNVKVPVIGGHSGVTILPLFSQATEEEKLQFTEEEVEELTLKVQNAGVEIVKAKLGSGSATLSMAQAAARFARSVVKGLIGEDIIEYAYVEGNSGYTRFFAQPIRLGRHGIEEFLPIGKLSTYEEAAINAMLPTLKAEIELGEKFVNG